MKLRGLLLSILPLFTLAQTPVVWEKIVPDSYDGSTGFVQWADQVPDIKLPPGKIFITGRGLWDADFLFRKGVTHLTKYDIADLPADKIREIMQSGKSYDDVPTTPVQLGLPDYGPGASNWVPKKRDANGNLTDEPVDWPQGWNERFFGKIREGQTEPMTYDEGYRAGQNYSTGHSIVIYENKEQDHALGAQWPLFRGFYDAYRPRMDNEWKPKGVTPYIGDNYFSGLNKAVDWLGGKAQAMDFLYHPYGSDMLPGGNLEKTNLTCFGLYFGAPDVAKLFSYRLAFMAYVNHAHGFNITGFMQAQTEWLPNNYFAIKYPEGIFFKQDKAPPGVTDVMSTTAICFIFGDGLIPFGFGGKRDSKFIQREYNQNGLWFPNGATSPQPLDTFPYWWKNGQIVYYGYSGVEDFSAFTVHAVYRTFFQVNNGTTKFLSYQIDNGEWSKPKDIEAENIVDAAYDHTAIVYSKTEGNKTAILYVNPFADNAVHTLKFKLPNGKIYFGNVSTNAPWLTLITE